MTTVPPTDEHAPERVACSCGEQPVNHPVSNRPPLDRTHPLLRDDGVISRLSDHEVYDLTNLMARLAGSVVRRHMEREATEQVGAEPPEDVQLSPAQQARARAAHARRLAAEKREGAR